MASYVSLQEGHAKEAYRREGGGKTPGTAGGKEQILL